jgi:hypothetical protein
MVLPVTIEEMPADFDQMAVPAPQRSSAPADPQRLDKLGIEAEVGQAITLTLTAA